MLLDLVSFLPQIYILKAGDTMSSIQELYDGELNPREYFGYSTDSSFLHIQKEVVESEKELLNNISEKEQKVFLEIKAKRLSLHNLEQQRMFSYGFRMASLLMIDIFKG